jgi:hypothetical protein
MFMCFVVAPAVVFVLQIEAVWHTGVVLGGFEGNEGGLVSMK